MQLAATAAEARKAGGAISGGGAISESNCPPQTLPPHFAQ